jgi:probable HAF family extracellular repeat protein
MLARVRVRRVYAGARHEVAGMDVQVVSPMRADGRARSVPWRPDRRALRGTATASVAVAAWLIGGGGGGGGNSGRAFGQVYSAISIDTFGGTVSAAHGINNNGVVVGTARDAAEMNHAFIFQNDTLTDLQTLGGSASEGLAINDAGQVAGFSHTASGTEHAFRYSGGVMTDLGTLGGGFSYGLGINNAGVVVGGSTTIGERAYRAFHWTGTGPMSDLGSLGGAMGTSEAAGIDADGTVVGYTALGDLTDRAFVYRAGVMTPLPTLGGNYAYAQAIRNGVIVGGAFDSGDAHFRAVLWDADGVIDDLGVLPGLTGSIAYALNGTGLVVGKSDAGTDATARAFLHLGGTMIDLNSLLAPDAGWVLQQARGINDAGQIVGFGTFSGQMRGFVLNLTGKIWSNPAGGEFATAGNWYGPGAPTATQSVAFALDSTYSVNIALEAAAKSVSVTRGDVGFNLSGAALQVADTLTVSPGATLRITGSGSLIVGSGLSVTGGRLVESANGNRSLKVGAVVTSAGGIVDLNDNDLHVSGGSTYDQVVAQIATARNGGSWDGSVGITSAAAAAASNTTLGVLRGDEYRSLYGEDASFNGSPVAVSDVLVKYTYYGDTNFSGSIDFDDYVRLDVGFNSQLSGWSNGDFNYSGAVDFDDYVLIDIAFNTQAGTLARAISFLDGTDRSEAGRSAAGLAQVIRHFDRFGTPYAQALIASVPEPVALSGASALVVLGLRRRGRRRRRREGVEK